MKADKVNKWTSEDGTKTRWYVTLDDGTEAVSFAEVEVGELEGWTLEPPKEAGWKPMLRRPKTASSGNSAGRIAAAYRNTEAGARMEVLARAANTSVMQARKAEDGRVDLADANRIYKWLMKASGAVSADGEGETTPAPAPDPTPPHAQGGEKRVVAEDPASSLGSSAPRCPACGSEEIGFTPDKSTASCLTCGQEWKA